MNRRVWIFSVIATVTVLVLASVAVAFAAQGGGGQGREKSAVCHKGHTLTVPTPALAAHERHGDTEGDCPAEEGTTSDDSEGTTPEDPESTAPDDPEGTTPDTAADDQYGQEKVTICHKGHTITVAEPALAAHQRHGDVDGACAAEDTAREDVVAGPAEGRDLYGDSGANTLRGTIRADFMQSGRGPDVVSGNIGNDYIDGVDGVSGNDVIDGGRGIDHCVGDEGDTFRYCDGNVVEVPSGTQPAK